MTKTMKLFTMFLVLFACLFTSQAKAQTNPDNILGKWTNEDKTRVLEFAKRGNFYEAVIQEAPDKNLIGQKQITNLRYDDGVYRGNLYLPKRGKTLSCTISVKDNSKMELSAKAGMMSQSQTWTRVKQ